MLSVEALIGEVHELKLMAGRINEHHDTFVLYARRSIELQTQKVNEALLCGSALNEAKARVKHGLWVKWVSVHCPRIGIRTAQKYMAFAKANHDSLLDASQGLTGLLEELGIVPERPVSAPRVLFQLNLSVVARWTSWFKRKVQSEAVLTWPTAQKDALRAELAPIAALYDQLIAAT